LGRGKKGEEYDVHSHGDLAEIQDGNRENNMADRRLKRNPFIRRLWH
jgi:hypothetical protein